MESPLLRLILDSSVGIAAERKRHSASDAVCGIHDCIVVDHAWFFFVQ